jgi:hypothetical protein
MQEENKEVNTGVANIGAEPQVTETTTKTQAELDAEALANAGAGQEARNPNSIGDIDEEGRDAFSRSLKARKEAGERLTREDLVRPQGFVRGSDTQYLPEPTEEEKNLYFNIGKKVGQTVVAVEANTDGSYNAVGIDQSTYKNIRLN